MFYLFAVLTAIGFFGFFLNAQSREGHRMVYSAVVTSIFAALAAYTGGYLG